MGIEETYEEQGERHVTELRSLALGMSADSPVRAKAAQAADELAVIDTLSEEELDQYGMIAEIDPAAARTYLQRRVGRLG